MSDQAKNGAVIRGSASRGSVEFSVVDFRQPRGTLAVHAIKPIYRCQLALKSNLVNRPAASTTELGVPAEDRCPIEVSVSTLYQVVGIPTIGTVKFVQKGQD